MAKRQKKEVYALDKVQAEDAFADYATASAKHNQLTAKMDGELTRIREKYQDQLAKLMTEKEEAFSKLEAYAVNNRDDFEKRKSIEMAHGTIGFRTGTPTLKTLTGFTWASVTKLIEKLQPEYIRTKKEPNKEAILANREKLTEEGVLKDLGIYTHQKETFFVEPKTELVEG